MTTELAPLNISEIQRKAREDIVVELSSDIYRHFQYVIMRSPANKTAQFYNEWWRYALVFLRISLAKD